MGCASRHRQVVGSEPCGARPYWRTHGVAIFFALQLWFVHACADQKSSMPAAVAGFPLELGENRLFISGAQRSYLDRQAVVVPVPRVVESPVTIEPEVEPVRLPAVKSMPATVRKIYLNGLVLRPDGSADIWVNGTIVNDKSDIKILGASSAGRVVLKVQGRRIALYPGHQRRIYGSPDSTGMKRTGAKRVELELAEAAAAETQKVQP